MYERKLKKTLRTRIGEILSDIGVDPLEFEWVQAANWKNASISDSKLVHKLERNLFFFFMMNEAGSGYWPVISPGAGVPVEQPYDFQTPYDEGADWQEVLSHALNWAVSVKNELDTTDIWDEFAKQQKSFSEAFNPEVDDAQFTTPEKQRISLALDKLEARLAEVVATEVKKGSEASIERIHALEKGMHNRFIYLHQSIDRLGKKDFMLLAFAALATIFLDGLFPAEARLRFMGWLSGEVQQLFSMLGFGGQ